MHDDTVLDILISLMKLTILRLNNLRQFNSWISKQKSATNVSQYFDFIDEADDFTSQQFKTIQFMDQQTKKCHKCYEISMMGMVCKPSCKGLQCPNCEMQNRNHHGVEYVQI